MTRGKKQISETMGLGILLALSGGLMDAYSYLFRDHVFANAQTGNILLLGVNLSQGNWGTALAYACPVLAFSCGIALAAALRHWSGRSGAVHWRQLGVLFEAAVLFAAAWFPQSLNPAANALISLACGVQVESFRKIEGSSVATTMCIGNLRLAIHSAVEHAFTGENSDRKSMLVAAGIILAFTAGAVAGSVLIRRFGAFAIWASTAILLICAALMFAPSGLPGEKTA